MQLEKAVNDDSGEAKLQQLHAELRVWKQKVAQMALQLEKDQKHRKDQDSKVANLQAENKKFQEEIFTQN